MSSHHPYSPPPHTGPAWRARTVEVLHLLTSLPLGLFYLLPALMLATAITAPALAHPWLAWTQELNLAP